MAEPLWKDGLPANREVAVLDTVEWLDLFGRRADWLNQENRERVRRCAEELRRFAAEPEET